MRQVGACRGYQAARSDQIEPEKSEDGGGVRVGGRGGARAEDKCRMKKVQG